MCVDEEVVLLEEQLASAHADIEQLQTLLAEAEANRSQGEAQRDDLTHQLEAAREQLASRDGEVESLQTVLDQAREQSRLDAASYREVILTREPDLPAELVAGDSIDEIEASLTRARQTVAQVRQHLESPAQALRVPAGSPARGAPDLSSLSATEKIRLGLQQS